MKLKELRKTKRLTQTDMAKMLNIKQQTYNRYELETSEPNLETLKKLSKIFNVSLDYICDNETKTITIEQQNAINLLTKLESIYLSMTIRYIEKLLDDQKRIKNKETNKQWN